MDRLYTTHDISQLLQVDPSTVSKWIDRNILVAFRTPGGHRRVRAGDLRTFLISHQMPVPEELGGDVVQLVLIDSDASSAEATRQAFRAVGGSVELKVTTSALEGLLWAADQTPHGLLVDLSIGDVRAEELIRRVLAHPPLQGVRVIAVTDAQTGQAHREAAIQAGAMVCVPKPLHPESVLEHFRVPLSLRRSS